MKVSWDKGDEQLKNKWDKFLKVEEAKRLGKRYYVAMHHFPEGLIKEYLKDPTGWDWSDKWTKEEAEKFYGFVPLSAASGEDNGLYYKLPLVPRDNVKEIVRKVRKETANTIKEEEEMPPTMLTLPSSTSAHSEKHRGKGKGKNSSSKESHSLSPNRDGNDRGSRAHRSHRAHAGPRVNPRRPLGSARGFRSLLVRSLSAQLPADRPLLERRQQHAVHPALRDDQRGAAGAGFHRGQVPDQHQGPGLDHRRSPLERLVRLHAAEPVASVQRRDLTAIPGNQLRTGAVRGLESRPGVRQLALAHAAVRVHP